jgi:hypothetical protein
VIKVDLSSAEAATRRSTDVRPGLTISTQADPTKGYFTKLATSVSKKKDRKPAAFHLHRVSRNLVNTGPDDLINPYPVIPQRDWF